MVVKYNEIQGTDIGGGITRRILAHEGGMMIVEATFQKGAVGTAHRHPHEQVSYILSGKFRYTMDGESYILEKIEERKAAKKEKNFARADEIRAELLEKGIVLEDTREGVKWKMA